MEKVVVTAICSAGVAVAVWLVVARRRTARDAQTARRPDEPLSARIGEGVRLASATAAAGVAGGILTFGLGGRLMMRVLAATSPQAQGFLTDAEERVGEVTSSGTIGFVAFVGVAAAVPAGVYVLARRWLPRRSLVAGLVAGGIGGGLLARPSGLLDPDNRDFDILSPTWLAVLLCLAVLLLGSLTIAVLADRWVATWPQPSSSPLGIVSLLPLAVYAIPPVAAVGVVLVASRVVAGRRGRARGSRLTTVGAALVGLGGVLGSAWILVGAAEILV